MEAGSHEHNTMLKISHLVRKAKEKDSLAPSIDGTQPPHISEIMCVSLSFQTLSSPIRVSPFPPPILLQRVGLILVVIILRVI